MLCSLEQGRPIFNQTTTTYPSTRTIFELISPKMMSNPPSSLQQRQRMHRRQNSTPVASFEAMRVNTSMPQQRQTFHRRGQSFDQQRSPIRKHHHGSTVSMTDIGQIHGQQILREAQQQRIPRPGQQHQQHHHHHQQNQINMNIEMPISPACGIFTAMPNSLPGTPYENMTMNEIMHQNSQAIDFSQAQQYFSEMNMPVSSLQAMGVMDENSPQYFQDNRGLQIHPSTGISFDNRRMSQPDLRVQTQLRPHTPSNQIQTGKIGAILPLLSCPFL
jgi:hypothetical protein